MPSRPGGPGPVRDAFLLSCLVLLCSTAPVIAVGDIPEGGGPGPQDATDGKQGPVSPWPMFRAGPDRNGLAAQGAGHNPGEELWRLGLGDLIYSSPAIAADGTIYIGCHDHYIYAVRPGGGLAWKLPTGARIDCSPAIGPDGTIYVGSDKLYAIDPDGGWKWRYPLQYGMSSSPAVAPDGSVIFGTLEGTLYRLDGNGRLLSWFNASGQIPSSPALDREGNIYFGCYDNRIYSLAPDLTLRWSYLTGDHVGATPAIGPDGTVYAGSKDGFLYALNSTGGLKWKHYLNRPVFSSTAIGPDGTLYVGSGDGRLCAINPNGILQWDYQTGAWVDSSPAVAPDGTVFVGSGDGALYAFFPNGTLRWRFQTASEVFSSPAIAANGSVVFGSWDRNLYCVGSRYNPPAAPQELKARFENGAVELSWQPPASDGGKPLEAYRIFRALGPLPRGIIAAVPGDRTVFTDRNLTGPGVYCYHIIALNPVGESSPSVTVDVTAAFRPMPPRNLVARAGNASVHLEWEPPVGDGGEPVVDYRIYWAGGGFPAGLLAEVPAANTSFDLDGLANLVTYVFEVTAVNARGESDRSSNATATPRPPPVGLPSQPRRVAAVPWDRAVDVTWARPESDGGHPVTSYRVYRQNGSGPPGPVAGLDAATFFFRDRGVANGRDYRYFVSAVNGVGEGPQSEAVTARPLGGLVDDRPPELHILEPDPGKTVYTDRITVRVECWDDSGITAVELSLDGLNWSRAAGTTEWSKDVRLKPGENFIVVRATDRWDNNATAQTTVRYEQPVSVQEAFAVPVAAAILVIAVVVQIALVKARRWRRGPAG